MVYYTSTAQRPEKIIHGNDYKVLIKVKLKRQSTAAVRRPSMTTPFINPAASLLCCSAHQHTPQTATDVYLHSAPIL